jgi:hypothetical protein
LLGGNRFAVLQTICGTALSQRFAGACQCLVIPGHSHDACDGSLFDLRKDSLKDIARTIIANVTRGRAEGLAREIQAQLKGKKLPAG